MSLTNVRRIVSGFSSALENLTCNSRPKIKMLTMLAGDNVEHAFRIVKTIEEQLRKLKNGGQLPVLYLVDSIVRNLEGVYLELFSENIVDTFCNVFAKADAETRRGMWKLRGTWDGVFPAAKLYSLDLEVHMLDPAWPTSQPVPTRCSKVSSTSHISIPDDPTSRAWISYQKKILELQKQKVQLEQLRARLNLQTQQQERRVNPVLPSQADGPLAIRSYPHSAFPQSFNKRQSDASLRIEVPKKMKFHTSFENENVDLHPIMSPARVFPVTPPPEENPISECSKYHLDMTSNFELNPKVKMTRPLNTQNSRTYKAIDASSPPNLPLMNLDINQLFQKLVDTGLIAVPPESRVTSKDSEKQHKTEFESTLITFDRPASLKGPADSASLYGRGSPCSSCGLRFPASECKKYSEHLDWHYRQNNRQKGFSKKLPRNIWYIRVNDWVQFDESDDSKPSWFEEQKQMLITKNPIAGDSTRQTVQPSVRSSSHGKTKCPVCHDGFEEFYHEDEDEWHLRPAASYEGETYHPLCLDHKEIKL